VEEQIGPIRRTDACDPSHVRAGLPQPYPLSPKPAVDLLVLASTPSTTFSPSNKRLNPQSSTLNPKPYVILNPKPSPTLIHPYTRARSLSLSRHSWTSGEASVPKP
jgi:hypothetical protein